MNGEWVNAFSGYLERFSLVSVLAATHPEGCGTTRVQTRPRLRLWLSAEGGNTASPMELGTHRANFLSSLRLTIVDLGCGRREERPYSSQTPRQHLIVDGTT